MKWLRAIIRFLFLVREIISKEGKLHFQRFRLLQLPTFAIYIHHILRSDEDRYPHDHPWHFRSYILKGSYYETCSYYDNNFLSGHSGTYVPGDVIQHDARDVHHITLKSPDVWTLVFVWGRRRVWGYYVHHRKEWIDFETYRKMKREGTLPL